MRNVCNIMRSYDGKNINVVFVHYKVTIRDYIYVRSLLPFASNIPSIFSVPVFKLCNMHGLNGIQTFLAPLMYRYIRGTMHPMGITSLYSKLSNMLRKS